jgi:hypothetical protein
MAAPPATVGARHGRSGEVGVIAIGVGHNIWSVTVLRMLVPGAANQSRCQNYFT